MLVLGSSLFHENTARAWQLSADGFQRSRGGGILIWACRETEGIRLSSMREAVHLTYLHQVTRTEQKPTCQSRVRFIPSVNVSPWEVIADPSLTFDSS